MMTWVNRAKRLFLRWRDPERAGAELDEEVQSYFSAMVERLVARGMTVEEARRAVRIEFEGPEQVKERVREAQFAGWIETVFHDTSYALRAMRKNPGFAAIAVLVLALGMGASTAIFSVVNAVLLRPLPYRNPERLVAISGSMQEGGRARNYGTLSLNEVEGWRRLSGSFESIGSFVFTALPVEAGDQSMYLVAIGADQGLLTTLGVEPNPGHNFSEPGSSHPEFTVIISHKLWAGAFHSDPAAVGRSIALNGVRHTVIGILPASFQFPRPDSSYFPEQPDLLFPVATIADGWGRDSEQWFAIGRLRAGIRIAEADAELKSLTPRISKQTGRSARVSALDAETTAAARTPLLLLFGVSLVLLLIACTNIMNLLFARVPGRQREMAIRLAAGATRRRLIRQMLTESVCLTFLSGVLGFTLAWAVGGALSTVSPVYLPVSGTAGVDLVVFGFAFAICSAAALFVGLFPALRMTLDRANLHGSLGGRYFGGRVLPRFQHALTVVQVALGFALLATAGVLTHSLWRLAVDPGFRTDGIAGFKLAIPSGRSEEQTEQLIRQMLETARRTPGVVSAGYITFLPPETRAGAFVRFFRPGPAGAGPIFGNSQVASEGYFSTMGIAVMKGRDFTSADAANSPRVAIVNDTFARRFFGTEALGQRISPFDPRNPPYEIVGIVRDTHDRGLKVNSVATAYLPYEQMPRGYGSIAVRTSLLPEAVIPELRRRVAGVDTAVPVTDFTTIRARIFKSLDEPRFYTLLAAVCALMAVLFVTLGLYGVVSYSVARQTPEIGVRMALGARPHDILRRVLQQGLWMAALGVALGLSLSLATSRILVSLLFQVKPVDPATLVSAAGLVLAVTLLASYLPAQRASGVDPSMALRHE